jgi:tetratricopeptide (TPR) repeat protein
MPNLIDHEPNLPLIQRLEGAVLAARQAGATDQLVETLLALAKGYFDEGATPKGLTQLEEALQLVEGSNRELESRLLGYKGMALARLGNVQFAQRALFRSLRLAEETRIGASGKRRFPGWSRGLRLPWRWAISGA